MAAQWTPPKTNLPKEFVDATAFLLAHGMGDPRGGKFVEVTVAANSSVSGGDDPIALYGWLMPSKHVIGIDGLEYTPVGARKEADLSAGMAPQGPNRFGGPSARGNSMTWAALLLIRGEIAEAEKRVSFSNGEKPFVSLANAYLVARFHRAVGAHMAGDDALALADAKELQRVRADFEKEGARIIGQERLNQIAAPDMGGTGKPMAFTFLIPIDALAKDSERRLSEGARTPLDLAKLKELPQQKRIKLLIANLDEVKARQWSQPGGVNVVEDPIVSRLVAEGNAAGDALLDVIEKDDRLTRSVSFGRDFFPARNLITVKDAAYAAFRSIAQFDNVVEYGTKPNIAQIREFWKTNKNLTPQERWMHTLADDKAGVRSWIEAAGRLIEPSNITRMGSWTTMPAPRPGDPAPPMKGEELRNRQNPSISDLITKRAFEVAGVGSASRDTQTFELGWGLELALDLVKWDHDHALATLQATSRRVMDLATQHSSILDWTGPNVAKAVDQRYALGDKGVIEEYAAWIVKAPEAATGQNDCKVLEPLVRFSNELAMQEAARQMFLGDSSPWNITKLARSRPGWNHAESLIFGPVLALAPVREAVRQVLADTTEIGKSWVENNVVYTSNGNGSNGNGSEREKDPLEPPQGEKRPYRVCDSMAMALTRLKGAPKFQPYWPEAEKAKAIAALETYVEAHVAQLPELIGWPNNWEDTPRH